jgi:hypothetical protein
MIGSNCLAGHAWGRSGAAYAWLDTRGGEAGQHMPGWTRVGAKRRSGLPASREGLLRPYKVF